MLSLPIPQSGMSDDLIVCIVMLHALFCYRHMLTRQAQNEGTHAMSANFLISERVGTPKLALI